MREQRKWQIALGTGFIASGLSLCATSAISALFGFVFMFSVIVTMICMIHLVFPGQEGAQ